MTLYEIVEKYLKKQQYVIFNTKETREKVEKDLQSLLDLIYDTNEYTVICNESNNPIQMIEHTQLVVTIVPRKVNMTFKIESNPD